MIGDAVLTLAVAAGSWILVGLVRRYAVFRGLVDALRARGSHSVPTPRGGGVGLLIAALASFVIVAPASDAGWRMWVGLAGVVPTAFIGWLDDHSSLGVRSRLAVHFLSGCLVVPLAMAADPDVGVLMASLWIAVTLCAINVVNFIDGIDGLIGLQAIVFGFHIAALSYAGAPGHVLGISLAAASIGFLAWNWAPARIFLGDAGSGGVAYIGVIAGVLVLREGRWPFLLVFLPLFPIFLDATYTLIRRARRGDRLTEPHRTHLYQRLAVDMGWGHARVSLVYGAAAAVGALVVHAPPSRALMAAAAYAILVAGIGAVVARRAAEHDYPQRNLASERVLSEDTSLRPSPVVSGDETSQSRAMLSETPLSPDALKRAKEPSTRHHEQHSQQARPRR